MFVGGGVHVGTGVGVDAPKLALTVLEASIVTMHVPVPEHPPPVHPAKNELGPAVAVNVTTVPSL